MYKAITVQVKLDSDLFEWCDRNAHCANNLYNAALFRERQLMFASKKNIHELTDNELSVMSEVEFALQAMNKPKTVPASGVISYTFLDAVMKYNDNPDYNADGNSSVHLKNCLAVAIKNCYLENSTENEQNGNYYHIIVEDSVDSCIVEGNFIGMGSCSINSKFFFFRRRI